MRDIKGLRIHFIGVNGTSMSGLMMLSHKLGAITSGSDRVQGVYFNNLKKLGMDVYVGVNPQKASQAELIVYSGAVSENHPEIIKSRSMERGEFLGFLSSFFKNSVAIAGTHGKTTVCAMICHVLKMAKKEFSYTFGGIDSSTNANWGFSSRKLLILEACEYRNSFLSLKPTISAITSIEFDHPDFFANFDEMKESFLHFAKNTKRTLILGKNVEKTLECSSVHVQTLAFDKDFQISPSKNQGECILSDNGESVLLKINQLGDYNLYNACLAYRVLRSLDIPSREIVKHLSSFNGVLRRQEFLGFFQGAKCYSDYAHHPTQIKALIGGFSKNMPIKVVFEPHTYSRTKSLIKEFSECFERCSDLTLLPVYEARESYDPNGDSSTLFEKIRKKNKYLASSYQDAEKHLRQTINKGDILLFVGAGTIDSFARNLIEKG